MNLKLNGSIRFMCVSVLLVQFIAVAVVAVARNDWNAQKWDM